MIDYPCPECGYDGPHSVMAEERTESGEVSLTVECGACVAEFEVVEPEADDEH